MIYTRFSRHINRHHKKISESCLPSQIINEERSPSKNNHRAVNLHLYDGHHSVDQHCGNIPKDIQKRITMKELQISSDPVAGASTRRRSSSPPLPRKQVCCMNLSDVIQTFFTQCDYVFIGFSTLIEKRCHMDDKVAGINNEFPEALE